MPQTTEAQIRSRARNLEIGVCYINSNWEEIREATILISRRHKQGGTTFGIFLIDLAMKGLKDTFYNFNMLPEEYNDFLTDYLSKTDHNEAEYALVHNIIYGAIEFGDENEYMPHKDFAVSQYILEEDTDEIPLMEIGFGLEGEPTLFEDSDIDITDMGHSGYMEELYRPSEIHPDEEKIAHQFPGNETPDQAVWKEFYGLCDELFVLKPWKHLFETDIFGVRLPESGGDYFVSVMGSNEQTYALAFYEGKRSVMEFWNLQQDMLELPPESILLISQIMLAWNDRIDVDPKQYKLIKSLNLSYRGKNAWPVILQTIPGYVPFTPSNKTMKKVNIILTQSHDVLRRELQKGNVIDKDQQDQLEYLFRIPRKNKGQLTWHDQLERFKDKNAGRFSMDFPRKITKEFNQLPVAWDHLEVNFNLLPFPIPEENTEGIFPFILMGVDPNDDFIALMHTMTAKPDFDTMIMSINVSFMTKFIELGQRPAKVSMKDLNLFSTLEFLKKHTPVKANLEIRLPAHQKAFESLLNNLENK